MHNRTLSVRRTLLAVAGTPAEIAFLRHLRTVYCDGRTDITVTLKCADSTACAWIAAVAARQARNAHYDARMVLITSDPKQVPKLASVARTARLTLVRYAPCFEGLLLQTLTGYSATTIHGCRSALAELGSMDWTNSSTYVEHFPETLLESSALRIQTLADLVSPLRGSGLR